MVPETCTSLEFEVDSTEPMRDLENFYELLSSLLRIVSQASESLLRHTLFVRRASFRENK